MIGFASAACLLHRVRASPEQANEGGYMTTGKEEMFASGRLVVLAPAFKSARQRDTRCRSEDNICFQAGPEALDIEGRDDGAKRSELGKNTINWERLSQPHIKPSASELGSVGYARAGNRAGPLDDSPLNWVYASMQKNIAILNRSPRARTMRFAPAVLGFLLTENRRLWHCSDAYRIAREITIPYPLKFRVGTTLKFPSVAKRSASYYRLLP
ncbi:hypothetical protein GGX14DRAFT_387490 [Mycena pura]|uniref:Uncharacterized protein n=1 Tax=Mycena pura TaxID=153505 RepID=A0AAD7E0T5_9AGAR|nr:hypothetical protein GGX14DRAFT_387490 [Mycena pura]